MEKHPDSAGTLKTLWKTEIDWSEKVRQDKMHRFYQPPAGTVGATESMAGHGAGEKRSRGEKPAPVEREKAGPDWPHGTRFHTGPTRRRLGCLVNAKL